MQEQTWLVNILPEAIGVGAGQAQQLLHLARALRTDLTRAGLACHVSGDIGGTAVTATRYLTLSLRVGTYPGSPSRPCVLHPFTPREESAALARHISKQLSQATGYTWVPVLLWGALSVTRNQGSSKPTPAAAVYLGQSTEAPDLDTESIRKAITTALCTIVGIEADASRSTAVPATGQGAAPPEPVAAAPAAKEAATPPEPVAATPAAEGAAAPPEPVTAAPHETADSRSKAASARRTEGHGSTTARSKRATDPVLGRTRATGVSSAKGTAPEKRTRAVGDASTSRPLSARNANRGTSRMVTSSAPSPTEPKGADRSTVTNDQRPPSDPDGSG